MRNPDVKRESWNEIFKNFPKNANSARFVVLKNDHPLHQNFKNISGVSVWDPVGKLINTVGSNWLAGCLLAQGGQEPEASMDELSPGG